MTQLPATPAAPTTAAPTTYPGRTLGIVGFVLAFLFSLPGLVVSLFVGAVGFAILALAAFGIALPGILLTIGAVLAALGFLVGVVVVYVGKEIKNTAAIIFVVAAVLAAIILLTGVAAVGLGAIATVLTVALAIALGLAGYYFRRAENRR